MRRKWKKCFAVLVAATAIMNTNVAGINTQAYAQESIGNGVILSNNVLELAEGQNIYFTASLPIGMDASRLYCVVENQGVATAAPVSVTGNVATFIVSFAGYGNTVVAVSHHDNPAVVAYMQVKTSPVIMEIPEKLGNSTKNYCVLDSYEFVPYSFTYMDFQDYKYTLKLKYRCASYKDDTYKKWGCYAYFYDAAGNVLEKKQLYCGSMDEGRMYHVEFNVPVNAVRFQIEGK